MENQDLLEPQRKVSQRMHITIHHQNVQGLSKKIERINHLMNDLQPTILILTEHGLSSDNLQLTRISGYSLITHYSRKDHKLGGVVIYLKDTANVDAEGVDTSDKSIELVCEMALAKIKTKSETFYILGVYRPPSGHPNIAIDILSDILTSFQAESKSLVLMGDINIDRLNANADNTLFEDELQTFGVRRLHLPATRITNHSKTSIDCICTNLHDDTVVFTVVQSGIADHTGQTCTILTKRESPTKKLPNYARIFSGNNLNSLRNAFSKETWDRVYNAPDAEDAYNLFLTTVRQTLDQECPYKKVRTRVRGKIKVRYDDEAKMLKEEFLTALHVYELTGNENDKTNMAAKKKLYDLKLRNLRQIANTDYITRSDNKSKAVWEIINSEKQCMQKEEPNLKMEIDGNVVDSPAKIVEHINSYFSQIADSTLKKNREELKNINITNMISLTKRNAQPLVLTPTNVNEVLGIITSLKPKLSCGVDEIPSKVVKHCAKQLANPLVSIINKSFSSGQFPSALKISKIYPKHKKGAVTKIENYRPISLISTFSKIIEKVALSRMLNHLERYDLITTSQHGFLKGRSTTTALSTLIEHILEDLENHKHVSAVLLDYSKAFDCLGHDLILKKLATLGIDGLAKEWVANYLKGRTQMVEIQQNVNGNRNAFRSKQLPVNRGVPQGSVLGPFLYLLFTNDFSDFIKDDNSVETIMYADDTTLLFTNNTVEDLHSDILTTTDKALQYCLQNDLAINPSKTTQINFSRRHEPIPIIPNMTLEKKSKFLGLTIDADLTWADQIRNLVKKLSSGVYVVKRMKWIGGIESAKAAYHAVIESHIRYGLIAWGGTSEGNLNKILVLQKKAIRAITNLGFRDCCREAFKSLKLLTVTALYIHAVVVYTDQLDLPRNEHFHSYQTRGANDYNLPAHHTTKFTRKPSYIGRKIINTLPQDLKNLRGTQLKKQLQDWLLERPVYSIKEFFDLL